MCFSDITGQTEYIQEDVLSEPFEPFIVGDIKGFFLQIGLKISMATDI